MLTFEGACVIIFGKEYLNDIRSIHNISYNQMFIIIEIIYESGIYAVKSATQSTACKFEPFYVKNFNNI